MCSITPISIDKNLRACRLHVTDRNNDRSTINRKLTESLFLVVKRNRKDNAWQFPQGKWQEGETMRQVSLN
jgi:8-oxo-dGTP pyrophosphatase MutT (NUDIX family)